MSEQYRFTDRGRTVRRIDNAARRKAERALARKYSMEFLMLVEVIKRQLWEEHDAKGQAVTDRG